MTDIPELSYPDFKKTFRSTLGHYCKDYGIDLVDVPAGMQGQWYAGFDYYKGGSIKNSVFCVAKNLEHRTPRLSIVAANAIAQEVIAKTKERQYNILFYRSLIAFKNGGPIPNTYFSFSYVGETGFTID